MKYLSGSLIKYIACFTMLIDHVGLFFYPDELIMRFIGRLSMGLFVFLLVEGFTYTRDRKKYLLRLALFAIISEPAYDIAFHNDPSEVLKGHIRLEFEDQNVIILLALGFAMMCLFERTEKVFSDLRLIYPINAMWLVLFMEAAYYLKPNYKHYGIAAIALCYVIKRFGFPLWMEPIGVAFALMCNPIWDTEALELFDIPIVAMYNGEKGQSVNKFFFYLFYPGHLLAIAAIRIGMAAG